jgi:hypothetical protein
MGPAPHPARADSPCWRCSSGACCPR